MLNAAPTVVKGNILLFLQVDERILMRKLLLLFACCLTGYTWAQLSADQGESTPEYLASLENDVLMEGLKDADLAEKTQRVRELIQRKSPGITQVFSEFLSLQSTVEVSIGVQTYETTVAAEMFATLVNEREKALRAAYYSKTNTQGQQRALNGLFGRDYTSLWSVAESEKTLSDWAKLAFKNASTPVATLNVILAEQEFKFPDYGRLKELCLKSPSSELLAALALHRQNTDNDFLARQMPVSYLAISLRPLPEWFAPLAERIDADFMNPEYQRAVAAYKNKNAAMLLSKIADKIIRHQTDKSLRKDELFLLYSNLESYSCAAYRPILKKIDQQLL